MKTLNTLVVEPTTEDRLEKPPVGPSLLPKREASTLPKDHIRDI